MKAASNAAERAHLGSDRARNRAKTVTHNDPQQIHTALKRKNPRDCGVLRVELGGLEPPTSWVRSRRSPN
jgi:hypothetical protein